MRATLVICPLVAVIQWRQEIARFTAPGSVKVIPVCRFFRPESSPQYMLVQFWGVSYLRLEQLMRNIPLWLSSSGAKRLHASLLPALSR